MSRQSDRHAALRRRLLCSSLSSCTRSTSPTSSFTEKPPRSRAPATTSSTRTSTRNLGTGGTVSAQTMGEVEAEMRAARTRTCRPSCRAKPPQFIIFRHMLPVRSAQRLSFVQVCEARALGLFPSALSAPFFPTVNFYPLCSMTSA